MLGVVPGAREGTEAQINTQGARGHAAKTTSEQKGLWKYKGENGEDYDTSSQEKLHREGGT